MPISVYFILFVVLPKFSRLKNKKCHTAKHRLPLLQPKLISKPENDKNEEVISRVKAQTNIAATKTENSKKTQKLLEKLGKETEELRDSQYKLLQNNDSFDLKENSEANDVYLEDIPP